MPKQVDLVSHDPRWPEMAEAEATRLSGALGDLLLCVHHIGSTAIPAIRAKPVIDLIPVVTSLERLDAQQAAIEGLGYHWRGELGLPGRRYCSRDDPHSGERLFQLHCYRQGSPEIVRHLAFRDYLRADPDLARAYEAEKLRCQMLHPDDTHAYTDCKNVWIRRVETAALRALDGG
ncbi:GrpB family protein [Pelagibius marinus]|uniref:GrpB family protein n=1 Tax=Pelagibius marinus TaxID=2762760 RepID=UPI0018721826|nr:GrpB family protein [Pelagibius marinus]